MEPRILGRTGLAVCPLALGTVELGMDYGIRAPGTYGRPEPAQGIRLIHAALERSLNLIDTARGYGDSERVIGLALRDRRDRAVLATKATVQVKGVTLQGGHLRAAMMADLESSLRALQTDRVELWQIHNVDGDLLAQAETVAEVFGQAKAQGKIGWTGGSFYGADLPLTALETELFDTVQVTYSVLDQRLRERVFPAARRRGVGILARSVLLQGALTERAEHLPERVQALKERSRHFRRLVAESGCGLTAAQAAIGFALAEPHIGAVLVGMRTESELAENLEALTTPLPPEIIRAAAALGLDDPQLLNPGSWYAE